MFRTSGARPDVWLDSTGALGKSASRGNLNSNYGPTFRGRKNQAFLASARRPPTEVLTKRKGRLRPPSAPLEGLERVPSFVSLQASLQASLKLLFATYVYHMNILY